MILAKDQQAVRPIRFNRLSERLALGVPTGCYPYLARYLFDRHAVGSHFDHVVMIVGSDFRKFGTLLIFDRPSRLHSI